MNSIRTAWAEVAARLNPARRTRTYPRAVKRKQLKNQRIKRDTDIGIRHNEKPSILLLTPAA
jgi:hypothetical protein